MGGSVGREQVEGLMDEGRSGEDFWEGEWESIGCVGKNVGCVE